MRTKEIIKKSAYDLFERKSFEHISVDDILQEAGVSRRTFYNHFADKYELMQTYFSELVLDKCWDGDGPIESLDYNGWRDIAYRFVCLMKERKAYFRHVRHDRGRDSFYSFFFYFSVNFYSDIRLKHTKKKTLSEEETLVIKCFVTSFIFLFYRYLTEDTGLDEEKVTDMLELIIPEDYRVI